MFFSVQFCHLIFFPKGVAAILRLTPWIIKRPSRHELKATMEFVEKKTGIPMVGAFVGMNMGTDAAVKTC